MEGRVQDERGIVAKTFEELASQHIDVLYRGALFLSGGEARSAERMLVDTLVEAAPLYAPGLQPTPQRWLEGTMARRSVSAAAPADRPLTARSRGRPLDILRVESLEAGELFVAAGSVPATARAALWLVTLRRWSYADAGRALGVPPTEIPALLEHRTTLLERALALRGSVRDRARGAS